MNFVRLIKRGNMEITDYELEKYFSML